MSVRTLSEKNTVQSRAPELRIVRDLEPTPELPLVWEVSPGVPAVPEVPPDLHIVGEAWSTDQGWIEGALQTVEALLVEDLKLAPPAWLR